MKFKNMVWLDLKNDQKQKYVEIRLDAPKSEEIFLDFNPLKISDVPDWNPMWEEWHCYSSPLRIYKQDYQFLLGYFNKIYPIQDAFSGTLEPAFDVCFDNWIGKNDWLRIMEAIKQDWNHIDNDKRTFFTDFLDWVQRALQYTSIIVVEGNL